MRTTPSRSALSTTAPLALVVAAAVTSCTPWHHQGEDGPSPATSFVIDGGTPALRPQISAATERGGDFVLAVRLPQRSYLTTLLVMPRDGGMRLLTTAEGEGTARTELAAGDHRFMLRLAPVFLAPNAVRAIADADHKARLWRNGILEMPGPAYTLVVVTSKPVSWATAQDALADVDLTAGSPREVLITQIARAVGTASGGEWGAAVRENRSLW